MNVKALRRIRLERYVFAVFMTVLMFIIAGFSNQKEIIFPEIVAIMTGALLAERQPWSVNKRKIFILTSLASLVGVLTVRYVHLNLFFQTLICLSYTGFSLIIAKTDFIPIISACILPVYLKTMSWIYPISVTIMALVIIISQWIMEKNHFRPVNHYENKDFDFRFEINHWLKLVCIFAFIALLPIESKNIYFLAPPLIVTFAEFANPTSKLRKKPFEIFGILVFAAFIGTSLRVFFNIHFGIPLVVCAMIACVLLFILFDFIHIHFPPSGAVLILPMILPIDNLKQFPFQVTVGACILILVAFFMFKNDKNNE